MYKKFEIKTYSKNIENELSDVEIEKKNSAKDDNIINKTDKEQKYLLETNFQPKSIFTKQNNNISFFQSNSNNNFKTSKNKNLNPSNNNKNIVSQSTTAVPSKQYFGEEKLSCDCSSLKRKSSNQSSKKTNSKENQRINIDELNTKYKKPKRTIKSYKKQFNIQKSDNFNMLSYRPIEYDSDINLNLNKDRPKIIQMYKKQEVDEIFFPSKRTHSPQSSNQKEEVPNKYQTHTLKYQSFFGSFNCTKNSRFAKSTSKLKINQLNDFNIDKLIEIGDKYANLKKPVLPLGKIMNNNIIYNNKIKHYKNKIPINSKMYNNYNCETQVFKDNLQYSQKVVNQNMDDNKKRVTKKIISKTNLGSIRNSKNTTDDNKDENQIKNNIKKNLNFNDESENKNNKKIITLKKRHSKNNSREILNQNKYEQNYETQNIQEISQNKTLKKNSNLNLSQKHNGNNNDNNKITKYNINNTRNEKQNNKNILSEPKLLTDDENNMRNKVINRKKLLPNKEILITENKNYNKNNKLSSNIYFKENPKNYYGYDERHNLEDTIDNHAYFESVHSKKKVSNLAVDKVI